MPELSSSWRRCRGGSIPLADWRAATATRRDSMTKLMLTDRPLHPQAEPVADGFRKGRMNRREYLATMAAFGVSAAGALALGGLAPSTARAEEPRRGGVLRVAMN